MTNKKKAKEIANAIWKEWKDSTLAVGAEDGANLMAGWKDAQFYKYIEAHKQPVLASETDDTIVGYSIDVDMLIEWLKSNKG